MPESVVIVGGSLAGLFHGLQHKRRGNNVTVLEQESGERHSHHAGVSYGPNTAELLQKYDLTGVALSLAATTRRFDCCQRPGMWSVRADVHLTNWRLLYNILRANFDGMSSEACPKPPGPAAGDGKVRYLAGQRVTALENRPAGGLTVHYEDVNTQTQRSIDADLVIGADGVHSTVRQLVNASVKQSYTGYVAWRGTLPAKSVSPETLKHFSNSQVFNLARGTYLVCYVIPPEDGNMSPEERLLNWVWYYDVPASSDSMHQIFTDIHGKTHHNTVLRGLVKPSVWLKHRALILPKITTPFRELLLGTPDPFVTKIRDAVCDETAAYLDGKAVLVGDAFVTLRPHIGAGTEQAAFHCLALEAVYDGQKSLHVWDREVRARAQLLGLLSILFKHMACMSVVPLLGSVCKLGGFWFTQRLGRR